MASLKATKKFYLSDINGFPAGFHNFLFKSRHDMNYLWKILVTAFLFYAGYAVSQTGNGRKWKLAWSDEFNYTGLPDTTKWAYDTGGHGWGNHELEYYTNSRKENARVENGNRSLQLCSPA